MGVSLPPLDFARGTPRLCSGTPRLRPESARKEHSVLPFLERSREEPITNSPPRLRSGDASTSLGEHLNSARGTSRLRLGSYRKEHSVLSFLERSREEPIINAPPLDFARGAPRLRSGSTSTSLGEHLNFARGTPRLRSGSTSTPLGGRLDFARWTTPKKHVKITRF